MEATIHSRRQIISGLMLALCSGLVPLGAKSAIARNGGQGGGNGGGGNNGGGNSGNSGRGNGSDSGSNGSGRSNGNGNDGGKGNASSGSRGRNSSSSTGTNTTDSRSRNDTVSVDNGSISVRHGSGIAEEVNDRGRYVMRDRSGRTIVNRAATKSDFDRLRSLIK